MTLSDVAHYSSFLPEREGGKKRGCSAWVWLILNQAVSLEFRGLILGRSPCSSAPQSVFPLRPPSLFELGSKLGPLLGCCLAACLFRPLPAAVRQPPAWGFSAGRRGHLLKCHLGFQNENARDYGDWQQEEPPRLAWWAGVGFILPAGTGETAGK